MNFSFQLYNNQEVMVSKLNLLSETKMMDYVIDVFKTVHPNEETPKVRSALTLA